MSISDIATMIMALATTGSVLYIARQVRVTRQQAKGQFLLALDERLENFRGTTIQLMNNPDYVPDQWVEVWRLMSVFERINIMVEDQILDIPLVDRLYGYLLIMIVGNDAVYQRVKTSGSEWQDFIDLCYAIADERRKHACSDIEKAFIERVNTLDKGLHPTANPFIP
ncbi:MAG: hypothetical protein U0670_10935 [Anaerolineae bacterium]